MDIAAASMQMSQASVTNTLQISVMKMAMDSDSEQSSQLNSMLNNMAIDTSKGNNIDIRV